MDGVAPYSIIVLRRDKFIVESLDLYYSVIYSVISFVLNVSRYPKLCSKR